jgi:hypothetical protein
MSFTGLEPFAAAPVTCPMDPKGRRGREAGKDAARAAAGRGKDAVAACPEVKWVCCLPESGDVASGDDTRGLGAPLRLVMVRVTVAGADKL